MLNIIDFDNTLFYTENALMKAYNHAIWLVTNKDNFISKEDWRNNFGNSVLKIFEDAGIPEDEQLEIKRLKKQYYPSFYWDITPNNYLLNGFLFDKNFKQAKNVICSNTEQEVVESILEHFNKSFIFDLVIGRNSYEGLELKPSTSMLDKAYELFQYDADAIHIFDDSYFGLNASYSFANKHAGYTTVHEIEWEVL